MMRGPQFRRLVIELKITIAVNLRSVMVNIITELSGGIDQHIFNFKPTLRRYH